MLDNCRDMLLNCSTSRSTSIKPPGGIVSPNLPPATSCAAYVSRFSGSMIRRTPHATTTAGTSTPSASRSRRNRRYGVLGCISALQLVSRTNPHGVPGTGVWLDTIAAPPDSARSAPLWPKLTASTAGVSLALRPI